jgi:hypothetical protein
MDRPLTAAQYKEAIEEPDIPDIDKALAEILGKKMFGHFNMLVDSYQGEKVDRATHLEAVKGITEASIRLAYLIYGNTADEDKDAYLPAWARLAKFTLACFAGEQGGAKLEERGRILGSVFFSDKVEDLNQLADDVD